MKRAVLCWVAPVAIVSAALHTHIFFTSTLYGCYSCCRSDGSQCDRDNMLAL